MVSCQRSSSLKGSKHPLQHHPHGAALVDAHSFVSMGVEARYRPCHSPAHCRHMKRQPSHCHCCPRCGRCYCNRRRHLSHCCRLCHNRRCCRPLPLPLAIAIAVAIDHRHRRLCCIAISHCRCHCRCCRYSIFVTVGHRSCHLSWPSPSPLPSAISKSCCLGAARIVFDQLKQRMLTLFYFVWTVGGALIKAG